ncbi:unnamed protein product [Anisakis simplex]|uniref:Pepsin-I3 domain-containing protein n=1 Tax=Anisakis simplex TaxID=6269 RepID=A0A0M3K0D2_ANISI|nr:unnamed protein product [Anisakis simplex]
MERFMQRLYPGICKRFLKNGHLYINGDDEGMLTPEQQQQLDDYLREVDNWSEQLTQSIADSIKLNANVPIVPPVPMFRNSPAGTYPQGSDLLPLQAFPKAPPFCEQ